MIRPLARILSKEGSNKGKIKFIRIGWSRFSSDDGCLDLEFNETYNGNEIKDIKSFVTSHRPQWIDYQYLLLFYKLDNRKSEHNIWKICNNSKVTEIKLNRSYSGTFSLSGFVLNLIEGATLVKEFIECLKEQWVKSSGTKNKEAIEELGNNLSILTQNNEGEENTQAMEEPLLPIDSVEFLIYMGEKIQERFENTILEEESPDSIKKQIKDYFEVIEECLIEFDKIYDSNTWYRFNHFPLVKKIMTNNDSFMNLLARSIKCHVVPYDSINEETEWGIDG